jgi:hypothetical protein
MCLYIYMYIYVYIHICIYIYKYLYIALGKHSLSRYESRHNSMKDLITMNIDHHIFYFHMNIPVYVLKKNHYELILQTVHLFHKANNSYICIYLSTALGKHSLSLYGSRHDSMEDLITMNIEEKMNPIIQKVCMYVCVYLYVYVYIYIYIFICINIHICICIYICKHMFIYLYIYVYKFMLKFIYIHIYIIMNIRGGQQYWI